jgi:hypothetical protein
MNRATLRDQVIRNFRKHLGQYQQKTTDLRVYQKLDPESIFQLLDGASPACRHAANDLLRRMSQMFWTITASPKEGGFDPSAPLHISIDVPVNNSAPAYHLNCRRIPNGLQIYEISQKSLART